MQTIPRGDSTKGPADMFTGDVYFDVIAKGEEPSRMRVNTVRFAPCARTAWHSHARGQTLHVTDGIGLVQSRGGEVVVMRPGDTVYTPPGEWHWHGAAPTHFMVHLAMWEGTRAELRGTRDRMGRARDRRRVSGSPRSAAVTISDAAQHNHDELFPGHVSTLKITDPELIEVFDNFAFDEVLRYGDLDTRTRLMVQLAAIIACQAANEYRAMLGAALTVGRHPSRGERRSSIRPSRTSAWPRSSTSCTPPTRCSPTVASNCRCRPVDHDARDAAEVGLAVQKQIVGAEKVDAHVRLGLRRRAAHPAVPVRQLLRRLPHPLAASTCRPASC